MTACAPPKSSEPIAGSLPSASPEARDDGTYLQTIDPLGGQWRVIRVGQDDFSRFEDAKVSFQGGGFLNHGAGCGGGYPAFYRLDGQRVTITRREPIRVGKCRPSQGQIAAAVKSESVLANFLDQAATWSRPNEHTLLLEARDGTRALLARPVEPHPELAGRWLIETIAGKPFVTERRPAILSIGYGGIGAVADCNSLGTRFTVPVPGQLSINGEMIATLMGCPPEDMAEDTLIARAISGASGYRINGNELVLWGKIRMTLRRPPAPDRRLAGSYESCGNTLLGAYHEGPITLHFDKASVIDNAQCRATYRTEGPSLLITLDKGSACDVETAPFVPGEAVPVGGAISTLAVTLPDGFGFNEAGQLLLRTNRGLLTLCRQGESKPFGSG